MINTKWMNKTTIILKTRRFDKVDSGVIIISSVSEAIRRNQVCTAFLTLMMITGESMLSKRPVLRIIVASLFLLRLFSFYIYCITNINIMVVMT